MWNRCASSSAQGFDLGQGGIDGKLVPAVADWGGSTNTPPVTLKEIGGGTLGTELHAPPGFPVADSRAQGCPPDSASRMEAMKLDLMDSSHDASATLVEQDTRNTGASLPATVALERDVDQAHVERKWTEATGASPPTTSVLGQATTQATGSPNEGSVTARAAAFEKRRSPERADLLRSEQSSRDMQ